MSDNHLLEIPGKKLHPVIWAELLRSKCPFSDSPRSQAAYSVAELHALWQFAHCLDCPSRSVASELVLCGIPSAWKTSDRDHCLFTFSHNKPWALTVKNVSQAHAVASSSLCSVQWTPWLLHIHNFSPCLVLHVSSTGVWTGWTSFRWLSTWWSWLGAKQAFIQLLHPWIAAVCWLCVMH